MKQLKPKDTTNKSDIFIGTPKLTKKQAKKDTSEPLSEKTSPQTVLQKIDISHCAVVVKSLLTLLLNIDHSCSADMFLLSCKVIARLVRMSNGQLGLKHLMSNEELLKLVNICIKSEIPWAPHALACLLQDILNLSKTSKSESDTQNEPSQSSVSWSETTGK